MPNRLLELRNDGLWQAKCFFFWCQTSGCGKPRLSFSTGPKLPDAPFKSLKGLKRLKPSKRAKPALGTAKRRTLASQSCSGAKLAAVASQGFLFLLARSCRMLPPKASKAWNAWNKGLKRLKPIETCQTGSWTCETTALASQVFLFWCQTSGCGKPRLSFSIFLFLLPRNCRMLPPNASQASNASKKRAQPALGAAKRRTLASQVVPFLVPN